MRDIQLLWGRRRLSAIGVVGALVLFVGCGSPAKYVPLDSGVDGDAAIGIGTGGKGTGGSGSGGGGSGASGIGGAAAGSGGSGAAGSSGTPGTGGTSVGSGGIGSTGGTSGTAGTGGTPVGSGGARTGGAGGGGSGGTAGVVGTGGAAVGGGGAGGRGGTAGCSCGINETCCGGSSCVNLQTAKNSCGTCGHDCLGGDCVAGQCQAMMLGRSDRYFGENGLSIGADYVYGKGETNLVTRARKDGTSLTAQPLPAFATSGCTGGGGEEIDGRFFYQWNDGTICRMAFCSLTDCDGSTQAFSSSAGSSYVQIFALDQAMSRVFWYDGTSLRFQVASTKGTPVAATVSSADLADVKWVKYASGGLLFQSGSALSRLPASGGQQTALGTATGTYFATSSRLYWASGTAISYLTLPTGVGGTQKVVDADARHIWTDDVDLYWDDSLKHIQKCKVDNCSGSIQPVFTSGCSVSSLRGEGTALYWLQSGGCPATGTATGDPGQIWKIAR